MPKYFPNISSLYDLRTLERILAICTGLFVAYLTLTFEDPSGWVTTLAVPKSVIAGLLGIVMGYLALEFFWDELAGLSRYRKYFFALAFTATYALILLYELSFVSILTILMVNRATQIFNLPTCLALAVFPTLSGGLISHFVHAIPYSIHGAFLYILFNLAILVIGFAVLSERREKERSEKLLQELQATQYLLSEAAKQDERLHISRDLHDQVGHHLTALSLQLEVAIHAEPDSALQHVHRARDISRLLLSDIRATISDIRSNTEIDLKRAIENLIQPTDTSRVVLDIQDNLNLHSATLAETLFRCAQESLTNARKHSRASRIQLTISKDHHAYRFSYADNGAVADKPIWGNGLTGMQERIEKLDGTMSVISGEQGFCIAISIPNQEL
ncbi:histidine kinase [Gilvimarinus sp. SDUM040013]|uniref:Histidine kinase n=1 Tax=Gilvimarinus gilvus TaxID=3058038 RepID=A0ABU4RWA2_9GAMM|nr:histidine kinase [Gilvimarinus sp. SDUM040013]MDO3387630.1 histidine kinase [Gilvimarinus sp. SDUM040013]MDX6848929.1 histidine kinase [Gilvimarinus sp. SDUM040013]